VIFANKHLAFEYNSTEMFLNEIAFPCSMKERQYIDRLEIGLGKTDFSGEDYLAAREIMSSVFLDATSYYRRQVNPKLVARPSQKLNFLLKIPVVEQFVPTAASVSCDWDVKGENAEMREYAETGKTTGEISRGLEVCLMKSDFKGNGEELRGLMVLSQLSGLGYAVENMVPKYEVTGDPLISGTVSATLEPAFDSSELTDRLRAFGNSHHTGV